MSNGVNMPVSSATPTKTFEEVQAETPSKTYDDFIGHVAAYRRELMPRRHRLATVTLGELPRRLRWLLLALLGLSR